MPDNAELEFIHELTSLEQMPVILVTGYTPAYSTAVQMRLLVMVALMNPLIFPNCWGMVIKAVARPTSKRMTHQSKK